MTKTINFSDFCDSFSDTYKNNFTYEGKRALFDYLEEYEESTGEKIELDTVALCCEYSEYASAIDCIKEKQYDHEIDENDTEAKQEEKALEYLNDHTQVITFDSGIIIADF
jgi:hypothetical protein